MIANDFPPLPQVSAQTYDRLVKRLIEIASRYSESRTHSELTETLPSRTIDSTLRFIGRQTVVPSDDDELIRWAVGLYILFLSRNQHRNRAEILKRNVASLNELSEEASKIHPLFSSSTSADQDPAFIVYDDLLARRCNNANLIDNWMAVGVSEVVAYVWVLVRWEELPYATAAQCIEAIFQRSYLANTLSQMMRREIDLRPDRKVRFYKLMCDGEPTPDILNRLQTPRRRKNKNARSVQDATGVLLFYRLYRLFSSWVSPIPRIVSTPVPQYSL